jgi:phosphoglycerate dehydrogenase-like enzyme
VSTRVVLHPDRAPGVLDELRAMASRGLVEVVDCADDDEVAAALREPGSVYVGFRWREDFLADGLAWVQVTAAGVDPFPLEALAARDVVVCNARGVLAGCVAEHALATTLAMVRGLPDALADQRAHRWVRRTTPELSQLTVGVLGLGAIGQEVAARARAFGCPVLGLRRSGGPVEGVEVLGPDGLAELCTRADVLVCALPGGDGTAGLVGAAELAALGEGWLVNVGRGSTVDEDAVVAALTTGQLRGAALDVVRTEPLPAGSALWDVPGLLVTGHSAALSPRWGAEWAGLFEANLAAARGERAWTSRVA